MLFAGLDERSAFFFCFTRAVASSSDTFASILRFRVACVTGGLTRVVTSVVDFGFISDPSKAHFFIL